MIARVVEHVMAEQGIARGAAAQAAVGSAQGVGGEAKPAAAPPSAAAVRPTVLPSPAAEIVTRVFREKAAAGPNPAPPCEASSFSPAAPSPAPAAPKPEIVIVPFVSETDVRVAITRQEKIYIGPKTIVTPSARDLASAHEVLVETELRPSHSTRVGTVDS